jgi:hypothetical protein
MADILSLLPLLACPVMMGAMMWLMMRGNKDQSADQVRQTHITPTNTDHPSNGVPKSSMSGFHICLNWKVVAGLAVVGLGIWAITPGLVWAAVPILVVLACPLSMLLMMRGMGSSQCATQPGQEQRTAHASTPDERLAELRAQPSGITREIAELEAER